MIRLYSCPGCGGWSRFPCKVIRWSNREPSGGEGVLGSNTSQHSHAPGNTWHVGTPRRYMNMPLLPLSFLKKMMEYKNTRPLLHAAAGVSTQWEHSLEAKQNWKNNLRLAGCYWIKLNLRPCNLIKRKREIFYIVVTILNDSNTGFGKWKLKRRCEIEKEML